MAVTGIDNLQQRDAGTAARRRIVLITGIWIAAAIPFLIVTLPPVMDLPNHLTRIWLLSGGMDQAPLSAMYEARWSQAATNIFIDLVGVALARVLPLAVVGKILLLAMFLAPPLAALWLNKRLFGRLGWWPLAGIAIVWSTTAVTGLISFQIGLAAAIAAATWVHRDELPGPRRLLAIAGCTAVLLFVHPFAALFFLALIIALMMGPDWRTLFKGKTLRMAAVVAVALVPVVLLMLLAPHPPGSNGTHLQFIYWQPLKVTLAPSTITLVLLSPIFSHKASLDLLLALPLFAVVTWAAATGRLKAHAGLLLVAGVMEIASPFLPMNIGDGGALVIRFPEMAALMALAGLSPNIAAGTARAVFAGVLAVTALARIGTIGAIWQARAADFDQLKSVAGLLPSGASVMLLQQQWDEAKGAPLGRLVAGFPSGRCAAERHYASLIVMWRKVFIPTLFTVPGQQPLAVKPPYRAKSVYSSGIPFIGDMNTTMRRQFDPYLNHWQRDFDYVLLLNADLGHTPLPGTRVVADRGFARLYQVVR